MGAPAGNGVWWTQVLGEEGVSVSSLRSLLLSLASRQACTSLMLQCDGWISLYLHPWDGTKAASSPSHNHIHWNQGQTELWARSLMCHSLKQLFPLMVSIQRIAQWRWHWLLTYSECGRPTQMMPELFLKNNLGVNRNGKIGSVTHE